MKQGVLNQELLCTHCGKNLDCWNDPTGQSNGPQAGDITVCVYCSSILQYTQEAGLLGFTAPSKEVLETIANDKDFILATMAANQIKRKTLH